MITGILESPRGHVSCLPKQKGEGVRTEPVLVTVTQQQRYLMVAVTPGLAIDGLKFILLGVLILIYCYIIKADYKCHHTFSISMSCHTDVSKRLAVHYNKTAKMFVLLSSA
jgi:hypothetical protein